MYPDGFNPRVMKWCAWCGFAFAFIWPFAAIVVSDFHYVLPQPASLSPQEVVDKYTDHQTATQMANALLIYSSVFYLAWGAAVTMLTRRVEGDFPILFHIQMLSHCCCVVVVILIGMFWGAASWRAGQIDASAVKALDDLGWLALLFTGAPFATYMIALALVTFNDPSPEPVFPRWSAWFNMFVSIFMIEAVCLIFFQSGPFSQNGVAVYYIPMVSFFVWIVTFAVLTLKAVNREIARREALEEAVG